MSVIARAGRRELAAQPRHLGLRLPQRVPDALQLGLEAGEESLRFAAQAVRASLESGELARVARGPPLAPPEPAQAQQQQPDQRLGRAPQARDLRHDAHRCAGAAPGVRPGRAIGRGRGAGRRRNLVRRAVRRDHPKLHGRPLLPEGDDVAILERDLAADALAVDERAVLRAQIAHGETLALTHDHRVPRGNVEIAVRIEPQVGQGVATEPDIRFAEGLDLPGARARQKRELSGHGLRVAR